MAFRIVSTVMAVLYLLSAVTQFNDPDPIRWTAIYLAAGVVSVLGVRGRDKFHFALPAVVGAIALVWALVAGTGSLGQVGFTGLFQSFEMTSEGVEEGREFLGLMIIAAWMGLMVLFRLRTKTS